MHALESGVVAFIHLEESADDASEMERIAIVEQSMRREAVAVKVRAEALFKQGSVYYDRSDSAPRTDLAIHCFKRAIVANSEHWESMLRIAEIEAQRSRWAEALTFLQDARAVGRGDLGADSRADGGAGVTSTPGPGPGVLAQCICSIGDCYVELTELTKAHDAFCDALELAPGLARALMAKEKVCSFVFFVFVFFCHSFIFFSLL